MPWYFIFIIILLSVIVLLLICDFIIAYFITKTMVEPYCAPIDDVLKHEYKYQRINKDEFEHYFNFEDFDLQSQYGYNLKCSYLKNNQNINFSDNKKRIVVLSHGWTSSRYAMLVYAKMYLNLGFDVFIYDHRNHFQSDKKVTTMGDKEADDLQTVIEYAKKTFGENVLIGTHGESMGAATVMINAGRYHSVDFVVEDCGYSSLEKLLKYQCKELKHLPTFPTIFFGNFIFFVKTKSTYGKVNPIKSIATCDDIPMYFIHGDNDKFVPSYMVYKNYDAKPGFKMLSVYKGSSHAHSVVDYKKEYEKNLIKFLGEAKIIEN